MNIHDCAANGDLSGLKRATRKVKHLDAVNSEGKTPLMVAVASERASTEIVQWLIECGRRSAGFELTSGSKIFR